MRIPTVIIETDNGPVTINQSEYNPETMKLADSTALTPVAPPTVVPAAPLAIDANNNPVNAGDGGQFVPPVAVDNGDDNAPAELAVMKKGKKFIVVSKADGNAVERDGIEPGGYGSEGDAWAAIMALAG